MHTGQYSINIALYSTSMVQYSSTVTQYTETVKTLLETPWSYKYNSTYIKLAYYLPML